MAPILLPQDLIFVIGCPGAGKGTLCSRLATEWGWAHVSVGDELRSYCQKNDEEQEGAVVRRVRNGELVPVEQLAQILHDSIERLRIEGYCSFIIDGFPRDARQILYIQDKIGLPYRVLLLECPKEIARKRVLSRKITSRTDTDTEDIFGKRFSEFQFKNPSIVAHYEAEDKLLRVDTSRTTEISFQSLLDSLRTSVDILGVESKSRGLRDRLSTHDDSPEADEVTTNHTFTAIYLIGAIAAGKTTLIEALSDHFHLPESSRPFAIVPEVARELVLRWKVDPKDIQMGKEVGMDLQRQILEEQQHREEQESQVNKLLLCDRSGLDPIVFAAMYGDRCHHQQMLSSGAWSYLKSRMQLGLVILCEPRVEWFRIDGVRIDAASETEQSELHALFVDFLQSETIPYKVLPASIIDCKERVDFVLAAMREIGWK